MDKITKKIISGLIILLLILSIVGGLFAGVSANSNFSGNEEYWQDLCSSASGYKENEKKCVEFKKYLVDKKNQSQKELNDLKGQIGTITGDIAKDNKIIQALGEQTYVIEAQIKATEVLVKKKQLDIDRMNQQIDVRLKDIEEKKQLANEYMIHMQGSSRVNSYFDFILGADSFVELSRRVEGLNLISKKNNENIEALNKERELLEENKLDLVFDQKKLQETIEEQRNSIEEQKTLQKDLTARLAKLREKHASLISAQDAAEAQMKLTADYISSIREPEVSTGGLRLPITSGFRVSASVWRYPNEPGPSGIHIGIDLAAPVGTNLVAPANGIVIATKDSCPTYGGFPSPNCTGYGNYVLMIVNHQGTIYGMLYGHMKNKGVSVRPGSNISAGQKIGEVGSSGSSTGPHVHANVYYLGNDSVSAAYNRWYNGPRNNNFGAGGNSVEYANRCEVKGMVAPCRLDPGKIFGLKVGDRR